MKKLLALFLALLMSISFFGCNEKEDAYYAKYDTNSSADIEIDFSQKDGSKVANLQKFDMFSPTWSYVDRENGGVLKQSTLNDLKHLDPLKCESFRVDMMSGSRGMGNTPEMQDGDWSDPNKTLKYVYQFYDELAKYDVMPYYILVSNPRYVWATNEGGNKKTPDMDKYRSYMENMAKAFKESGRRVTFETWNEPDLNTDYWQDGMPAFIDMNVQGALALKKGDPDAYVVEVASCWPVAFCENMFGSVGMTLWDYYMKKTAEANNTIDAFSWHYYGSNGGEMEGLKPRSANFSYYKQALRDKINRDNDTYNLHTMTQHVTEYATSQTKSIAISSGLIPNLFKSFEYGLDSTDISRISWCAYSMSEGGSYNLIDPGSHEKHPIYYLHWAYARMPQVQAKTTFVNTDAEIAKTFLVRTGVDSKRASAIITNNTVNPSYVLCIEDDKYEQREEDSRKVNVRVKNIPFDAKSLNVYVIDNHSIADTVNTNEPVKILTVDKSDLKQDAVLSLKLPGNSAFYIEYDDGTGLNELDIESNLKDNIVRKDYYYEERADLMPYSDIYEQGFNVTLGSLNHATGKTAVSIVLDGMNEHATLNSVWRLSNALSGTNSGLGVRVDYHALEGYIRSESFYVGNASTDFIYSGWGTGTAVDNKTQMISNSNFNYTIPLAAKAPLGWDGRIKLTFYLTDVGANVVANVRVNGN